MRVIICVSFLLALVSSNSLADEPAEAPDHSTSPPLLELTPAEQEKIFGPLISGEQKRGFVILPKGLAPLENPPKLSGEWIDRDGVRECDGYLTRIENEEYCAAEVPSDWQPFEFDGMTYYVQPIKDEGE